jgi:hypothetical protein
MRVLTKTQWVQSVRFLDKAVGLLQLVECSKRDFGFVVRRFAHLFPNHVHGFWPCAELHQYDRHNLRCCVNRGHVQEEHTTNKPVSLCILANCRVYEPLHHIIIPTTAGLSAFLDERSQ